MTFYEFGITLLSLFLNGNENELQYSTSAGLPLDQIQARRQVLPIGATEIRPPPPPPVLTKF